MDKNIEEVFVKKFVVKEKRDRVLYELFSVKKREDRVSRLYNDLDKRYLAYSGQLSENKLPDNVNKLINKKQNCYVIANGLDDGTYLPFTIAFKHLDETAGVYIIFCAPDVLIAKDEVCFGSPDQCVLHKV